MANPRTDQISAGLFVLLGSAIILIAQTFPDPTLSSGDPLGPKTAPMALGGALIFLSLLLFMGATRRRKTADSPPAAKDQQSRTVLIRATVLIGLLTLFGLLLGEILFGLLTFGFLAASFFLFGLRRVVPILVVAAVGAVISHVFFLHVLNLQI